MTRITEPTGTTAPTVGWLPKSAQPNWFRRLKGWQQVGLVVAGIVAVCAIGSSITGGNEPTPQVQPLPGASVGNDTNPPVTEAPPAQPVTVTGNGNNVVQVGAILNGAFTVAYSAPSYDFLIVDFLKEDGTDGMSWEDMGINEYQEGGVSGTVILHLENVTMVQASNTQGDWTLIFTPLG